MKALVTGASGFIGSTLVGELDTLGFEVHALLRKSSPSVNLEGLKVQKIIGDLSDFDSLCRAVKGMDYIFHLAGVTHARNRSDLFEWNVKGTERVAQAIAKVGTNLTRFVYVSSLAASGPATSLRPKVESDPDHPISFYGESKLQAEKELLKFKEVFPIAIVRPALVYGPKDKTAFLMVQTLARNLMPILQGSSQNGYKYYSTIHSEDLCQGMVQIAVASKEKVPSGEVFYLASDGFHTYQELVSMIAEKLNCDPMKIRIPKMAVKALSVGLNMAKKVSRRSYPLNLDKLNEIFPDYWICSNQKAKNILGFRPDFDLSSGIAHAVEWYRRQRWI